ncbi:MAG: DUF1330 domain-containing protein, partial [Bacteroidota bacterium]
MTHHIHASPNNGRNFVMRQMEGPVVMLNLLKFKEVADYSAAPELAPDRQVSGKEAYGLYMNAMKPLLKKAGAELLFMGKGGHFLIGPEAAGWDAVLLVRQKDVSTFLAFAEDPAYQAVAGHRTAA